MDEDETQWAQSWTVFGSVFEALLRHEKSPLMVAKLLNDAIFIAESAAKTMESMRSLQKEYEEAMAKLQDRLVAERNTCPHLSSTHHPDPSGNNDSYYECDHCGKTL